jgi:hypothetical protein
MSLELPLSAFYTAFNAFFACYKYKVALYEPLFYMDTELDQLEATMDRFDQEGGRVQIG